MHNCVFVDFKSTRNSDTNKKNIVIVNRLLMQQRVIEIMDSINVLIHKKQNAQVFISTSIDHKVL